MTLLLNASNAYLSGTIDLTDTPQLLLTNSSTYTVASALSAVTAEEVSGNGYTRPTLTVQNNSISPGGDSTLIYNLATITATGGAITFDRVVLIADGDWVGYWDYGSEQTIANGTTKPFRGITVTRSDSGTLINGQNGSPAWSVTTATFTHPASVGGTVSVSVADTSWMAKGQPIFFSDETNSGNYKITAIGSATSVTVERLDSLTVGGTVMQVGKFVCSGLTGATGIAGFGLRFTHSSTTTSPPGSGELRFNHASPGSATAIYIDAEDRNSVDVSAIVAALNAGSLLMVIDENNSEAWALFTLGSVTDNTTNLTLAVTAIGAIGSFSGNISLSFAPKGTTGATGATGSVSPASALVLQEQLSDPSTSADEIKIFNDTNVLQWRLESDGAVYTVAGLEKSNTWLGAQGTAEIQLTDATNIAVNASLSNSFWVTLAGNRTLNNPTNLVAGFTYTFRVIQDATGSRTLAYGTAYKFPGGTDPTLSTAANAIDYLSCASDGTSLYCVFTGAFS